MASGTIEYASVDPVIGGEVTFTTTTDGLHGNQYPMVYLVCQVDPSNFPGQIGPRTVYGQLDHPEMTFILGGGSSPWITPSDPDYQAPATCHAELRAYGPKGDVVLATAPDFEVTS